MKIIIGIKQDDKVIYLVTTKLCDIFDVNKFVSAIKIWLDIYFKFNKGVEDEVKEDQMQ